MGGGATPNGLRRRDKESVNLDTIVVSSSVESAESGSTAGSAASAAIGYNSKSSSSLEELLTEILDMHDVPAADPLENLDAQQFEAAFGSMGPPPTDGEHDC